MQLERESYARHRLVVRFVRVTQNRLCAGLPRPHAYANPVVTSSSVLAQVLGGEPMGDKTRVFSLVSGGLQLDLSIKGRLPANGAARTAGCAARMRCRPMQARLVAAYPAHITCFLLLTTQAINAGCRLPLPRRPGY